MVRKNVSRYVSRSLFILFTVLVLTGCGGNDPKALAKETYDIGLQALNVLFNPEKAAELEKKALEIEAKVEKLSAKDRATYDEELARLAEENLGSLFDAAGALESLGF